MRTLGVVEHSCHPPRLPLLWIPIAPVRIPGVVEHPPSLSLSLPLTNLPVPVRTLDVVEHLLPSPFSPSLAPLIVQT